MTNAFSALSLKRNRSASTSSKKESKFNSILNKLTSPFQTNHNKKRRQHHHQQQEHINRRSSLSIFIDYFRTEDVQQDNHPFVNDALFEQNRYKQQKQQQQQQQQKCILSPPPPSNHHNTTTGILMKKKQPMINHRHTNSSPSAITTTSRRKKSSHIRHYSHVSCISASNITVNSEDLTAKEFADIAGIRILSEDDLQDDNDIIDDDYNSYMNSRQKKICTFCGDEENDIMVPSLIVNSRISHNSSIIMRSSNNSSIFPPDEDEEPQIWDNHFWRKPGQEEEEQVTITPQIVEPPPILHELKRNNNSVFSSNQQETYIKKGRFEIHLSVNNSLPVKKPAAAPTDVFEWKRKSRPTTLKHQVTA